METGTAESSHLDCKQEADSNGYSTVALKPQSLPSDKPPPIELHFLNLLKHAHQLGTKDQIYESIGVIFS